MVHLPDIEKAFLLAIPDAFSFLQTLGFRGQFRNSHLFVAESAGIQVRISLHYSFTKVIVAELATTLKDSEGSWINLESLAKYCDVHVAYTMEPKTVEEFFDIQRQKAIVLHKCLANLNEMPKLREAFEFRLISQTDKDKEFGNWLQDMIDRRGDDGRSNSGKSPFSS